MVELSPKKFSEPNTFIGAKSSEFMVHSWGFKIPGPSFIAHVSLCIVHGS
jgi:hypothetical protein